MNAKLYCEHCGDLFPLPAEDFARDAAVEWFGELHAKHLQGGQDIFVVVGSLRDALSQAQAN